jgi:membrane associated rhomboid family serine protease
MSNFRFTRPDAFPPIIKNLIIINVLVWLTQLMYDEQYEITLKLALYPVDAPDFKPYQLVTHMFAHATLNFRGNIEPMHILFNMLVLWMFGRVLEMVWGHKRFLFFYLACGLGAGITHLAMQYFMHGYSIAIGASGAVMGVMVAFAYLFPNTEMRLMFLPMIGIKAKWFVTALVVLDLFGGINPRMGDNVAHFAHLGGALTGFIICFIWNKTNRKTLY